MRDFFLELGRQLKAIWSKLEAPQRAIVIAVLLAAGVGLGAIVWFSGRPSYERVLTAVDGDQLREANRLLSKEGVSTVPGGNGFDILVERGQVARAHQILAEGGMLESGSGGKLEGGSIIEDSATKAARLDRHRIDQTEQAIRRMDGVRAVTVIATMPPRNAFGGGRANADARASVLLQLRASEPFEAVASAAASQAASGLGVPLANVDVVDSATKRRWTYDADRQAGGAGNGDFVTQQREMSEDRSAKAQAALDSILPGKTRVVVNIELDPTWEIRTMKVLPDSPVPLTENSTKDTTTNATASDPSSAATATAGASSQQNQTSKETRQKTYLPDIGESRQGKLAPEIRKMTVALFYDKALEQQGFDKQQLVSNVKALVGWDSRFDDSGFSTMASEFPAPEAAPEIVAGPGMLDIALQWAPTAGQVLGVVFVLLFLRGLFKRSAVGQDETPVTAAEEKQMTPDEQARRMRREIERAIAQDPAALAKMMETWLAEQRT